MTDKILDIKAEFKKLNEGVEAVLNEKGVNLDVMDGEVRLTSETGGQKGSKLSQLGDVDPMALYTLGEVAGFGAQKYDQYNYLKGFDWSLSFSALYRHMLAFWSGQDLDEESGLPHMAHAAWHCLVLTAFLQRGIGTDNRPTDAFIEKMIEGSNL